MTFTRFLPVSGRAARTRALMCAVVAAAALAVISCSNAPPQARQAAQAPAVDSPRWLPRYDWALEVDGKPADEAQFFVEQTGRRILLRVPALRKAALINPEGKQVVTLDPARVVVEGEGEAARLSPEAEKGAATDSFTMSGAEVVFYLGGNRMKITPKAPLEGPATADAILRHSPLYRQQMIRYTPEGPQVAYLRSLKGPVQIEVFFGTWCPHCKELVPKFMKAIEAADNPDLSVSYVGLPRAFLNFPAAQARGVRGVPTFIVYRAGKELGRIPGEPTGGTIEKAVADILRAFPN